MMPMMHPQSTWFFSRRSPTPLSCDVVRRNLRAAGLRGRSWEEAADALKQIGASGAGGGALL